MAREPWHYLKKKNSTDGKRKTMSSISKAMEKLIANSSVLRTMFEEGKQMAVKYGRENVFDFSLGNPSTPTPPEFNDAVRQVLDENDSFSLHSYMSNAGYEETRQAIADNLNERFGSNYAYKDITMTVGAANAIVAAIKVLTDPGDEVVVFAPYFLEYGNYISNFGAVTKVVPANPPTFIPDPDELRNTLSEKTKAVIINNPNNPTGVVYDDGAIKMIASVMEEAQKKYGHSIYLITDEPYREIVYDGVQVPFIAGYYRNTLMAYSFSKAMSVPGERIGYLAVSPDADESDRISTGLGVAIRVIGCVNAPSLQQKTIIKVLDKFTDVSIYDTNRKILMAGLDKAGLEYVRPDGTFYLFVKTPTEDDREFSERAKDKYHMLLSPGSAFCCPGYVRIAYCVARDTIERALPLFEQLAEEYR